MIHHVGNDWNPDMKRTCTEQCVSRLLMLLMWREISWHDYEWKPCCVASVDGRIHAWHWQQHSCCHSYWQRSLATFHTLGDVWCLQKVGIEEQYFGWTLGTSLATGTLPVTQDGTTHVCWVAIYVTMCAFDRKKKQFFMYRRVLTTLAFCT